MDVIVNALLQYLNLPYIWGGKNPMTGLDCSGLASDMLHMAGAVPRGFDENAQGIHDYFIQGQRATPGEIAPLALAFYGPDVNNISHVAVLVSATLIIEAGHGDSSCRTREDAVQREAMVRIRPYNYRSDLVTVLRPKYAV